MEPALPLAVDLPKRGSRRRTRALHAQLRAAIVDGRLKPGLRLPSSRGLARQFGVSRNSVIAVYDLLFAENYVTTRPRGGTYVAGGLSGARDGARTTAVGALRPVHPAVPAAQRFRLRLRRRSTRHLRVSVRHVAATQRPRIARILACARRVCRA
jgi:DNA-binding FadR family transcriptional regulator